MPLGQRLGVLLVLPSLRRCWSFRRAHPTLSLILRWRCSGDGVGRMICSMWRRTKEDAINRRTPRAKGGAKPGPEWARPVGPGPFRPDSAPVSSPAASGVIPYLCALACGP
jgi:hypothetical protein